MTRRWLPGWLRRWLDRPVPERCDRGCDTPEEHIAALAAESQRSHVRLVTEPDAAGRYTDWLGEPTTTEPPATVAYPRVGDSDAKAAAVAWVTDRLLRETGGLTRNPWDRTEGLPTAPTPADIAAREYVTSVAEQGSYWTRGFSMRYLADMQTRALRRDVSLTTDELLILRGRGLM